MSAAKLFTVVLRRRPAQSAARWRESETALAAVLPCAAEQGGAKTLREGAGLFAFHGVPLALHRDMAESYWANVSGENPRLFAVCREADDDGGAPIPMRPILLTASGDEAAGHNETDDLTLSAPMPDVVRDFVEAFVMENYFPEPKRKRKRQP